MLIGHRAWAAAIVALALFVRALVPGGYMAAGDGRSITVTLCADASGTSRQIAVPLGAPDDAGKDRADQHQPCAFAAMAAALDTPPQTAAPLPRQPVAALPFAARLVSVGRSLAAPPPPQTGPPAST